MILRLALLAQWWLVTDGQTHDDSINRASIASRGKNGQNFKKIFYAVRYCLWFHSLMPNLALIGTGSGCVKNSKIDRV